ncbi:MAG: Clp protease N-terminal domain-containing protein, partial [Eudoraea sp.]
MNINNFTIKSQEVIQHAQILAQSMENPQIENEHIYKAIVEIDENVLPFVLKKLNVNISLVNQILEKDLESLPKVSGGEILFSKEAGKTLNEANV